MYCMYSYSEFVVILHGRFHIAVYMSFWPSRNATSPISGIRKNYSFFAVAAATACIKSRWLLESVNSSTSLTFRLPSSSVTMWSIRIDSRVASIPATVFNLVVICVGRDPL